MMAGQIEEPISFDFQADSVHSGSISFGKFANEPLMWERRSSFSHNRIEEEVARCSKHRIVTEKKAYFEAQFKKKALLRQCSLDAQTGIQYKTGEKDNLDMRSCKEDIERVQGNEACYHTSVYTGYREDYDNLKQTQVNVDFDESSYGSNDFEERGMDYLTEGRGIMISEPLKLPSSDCVEAKVGPGTATDIDAQTVIDCSYSRCNSAEHDVELEQNIDALASYVVDELKDIGLCTENQNVEREPDCGQIQSGVCPQVMVAIDPSETKSNAKVTRTRRDSLRESAKMPIRNRTKVRQESDARTRTFKQAKIVPSALKKLDRSPNPEHLLTKSTSFISKTHNGLKSVYKETKVIGVTKSSVPIMMRGAPNAHPSPKRTEKVKATKSSVLDPFPSSLRLRSDLRAEEKKEIPLRVKQTGPAQNTEINRSHARVQGKNPGEIKQFSRDLEPKPVRRTHNKDERLEPKSKDVIAKRPQMNPSHTRTKVVVRSSMNLKSEYGPQNSPSWPQSETAHPRITSYPGRKSMTTSVTSTLVNKSNHSLSKRNAVSTKEMAGIDKAAKLKNKTVAPKVAATEVMGNIGISQSVSEKTKICKTTSVSEKARLQNMCRPATKVC